MTVVLDLPDNCGVINISAVFDNPPHGYTFTNWAISPRKVAMITHDGSPTGIWTETPRNNPEEAKPAELEPVEPTEADREAFRFVFGGILPGVEPL